MATMTKTQTCAKLCPCGARCPLPKGHDGTGFETPTGIVKYHQHTVKGPTPWVDFQQRVAAN